MEKLQEIISSKLVGKPDGIYGIEGAAQECKDIAIAFCCEMSNVKNDTLVYSHKENRLVNIGELFDQFINNHYK